MLGSVPYKYFFLDQENKEENQICCPEHLFSTTELLMIVTYCHTNWSFLQLVFSKNQFFSWSFYNFVNILINCAALVKIYYIHQMVEKNMQFYFSVLAVISQTWLVSCESEV